MPRPHYQTHNSKSQTTFRQKLRHTPTTTEQILWKQINQSQLGVKFRRQHGVGKYVLDFYAPQLKLAIELDGDSHFQPGKHERDIERDKQIQSHGITILRFADTQVIQDLESVIQTIQEFIDSKGNPT